MANLSKEKTTAQKVVLGLELDDSDQPLPQYFNFITQFLKAESRQNPPGPGTK